MVKFFYTSVKTNWKYIAIVAMLGLAVGGIVIWLGTYLCAYSDLCDTRGTFEGRLYGCFTSEECVLVRDGWCDTVIAVNKDKKSQWEEVNARQTEVARRNRQTCKLVNSEDLNPDNFVPRCEKSQCIATKKLDVGLSLPREDTSTWQTYRNDEFGFEFKYPADWNYHPGIDSPAWSVSNDEKNGYLLITLYTNDLSCLRQKIYTYQGRTTWREVKKSETLIGSHKASLIEGKAKITGYSDPQLNREFDYKIVLLSKGLGCYDLSTQTFEGVTNESKKNLDQILSTFRFVE